MNYEDIKKLIEDMGNSKIDALDIEFPDGVKISMKKNTAPVAQVPVVPMPKENVQVQNVQIDTTAMKEEKKDEKVIKSPMVGTFYASNSPKEEPFVKVGDKVKKGQVVCIVEAMKLMNEIESEYDGEIAEICVSNEEMVEYGTPLFKLK